jgi:hypothetical protein
MKELRTVIVNSLDLSCNFKPVIIIALCVIDLFRNKEK